MFIPDVHFGGTSGELSRAMVYILARHSQATIISMVSPYEPDTPLECVRSDWSIENIV